MASIVKITTEEWIERANKIHNYKYDYSKSVYTRCGDKIEIICKEHGSFLQNNKNHLNGFNCPKCAAGKTSIRCKMTTEEFIKLATDKHGDKYDYSLTEYGKDNKSKVKIICLVHGVFEQSPNSHLKSGGCLNCGFLGKEVPSRRLGVEEFIKRSKEKYGNKYDYSKTIWKNNRNKVKIICNRHKIEFEVLPDNHLKNLGGCPDCNGSVGEEKIKKILILKNVLFEEQKRFTECRNKKMLRFDFYLPDHNLCIEFDGIQHFKPHTFGSNRTIDHKNKNLEIVQFRDKIKTEYCKNNRIKLLRIPYYEFDNILLILEKELNL